ncbi:MAG: glycosyltransferase family 4 protein [Alphaproteobacteria bacterium]|nr:glycosyltransferase family 4 protein [Alphaproteobacteria bacterium]
MTSDLLLDSHDAASGEERTDSMDDLTSVQEVKAAIARLKGPKVLQVLPALGSGGVERGTLDISRYLIGQGWTPLVVSNGGEHEADLFEIGAASINLPVHSKNPLTMRANVKRLAQIIRNHDVQLVHARSRAPAWSAYYAAKRTGVPFVTTFHSLYSGADNFLKRGYNAIMTSGERVIAISDYVAEHVTERYGVGNDRLRVIPRGVDLDQFDPLKVDQERIARLRASWQLEDDKRIIMLPGRISERKGHVWLLEALHELWRGGKAEDTICIMVGSRAAGSAHADKVEKKIIDLKLENRAWLVGPCKDMPAAYALADIVVAPSIGPEAFGRVSIEAQAMGKPVIATDSWGLSETIMPAATGWLVRPEDVDHLAGAIELALAMPEDARARLSARARRFVDRHYSLSRMGKNTLSVYRELVEGRKPQPSVLPDSILG